MKPAPSSASFADKTSPRRFLAGGIACLLALTSFSVTARAAQGDSYDIAIRDALATLQPPVFDSKTHAVKKPSPTLNTATLPQLQAITTTLVHANPADAAIYVDRIINPDGWVVAVGSNGIGADNGGHTKAGLNVKIAASIAQNALTELLNQVPTQLNSTTAKAVAAAATRSFATGTDAGDKDRAKVAAGIITTKTVTFADQAGAIAEASANPAAFSPTGAGSVITGANAGTFAATLVKALGKTPAESNVLNLAGGEAADFTVASLMSTSDAALQPKADIVDAVIKAQPAYAFDIVTRVTSDVLSLNSAAGTASGDTFLVNFGAKIAFEKNAKKNIGTIAHALTAQLSASAFDHAAAVPNKAPTGALPAVAQLASALATGQFKSAATIVSNVSLSTSTDADTVGQVAGAVASNSAVSVKDAGKIATAAKAFVSHNDVYEIADGMATAITPANMVTAAPLIATALGSAVKGAADEATQMAAVISSLTAPLTDATAILKTVTVGITAFTKAGGVLTSTLQAEVVKALIAASAGQTDSARAGLAETVILKVFKQKASTVKVPNAAYDTLHALETTANWSSYVYGEVVAGETNNTPI